MRIRLILPILLLSCISLHSFSQRTCGVHEHDHKAHLDHLEKWLISAKKSKQFGLRSNETLTVPVVFHIIHNGEDLGTGANIPDERIMEQIAILNQDFNRLNADTTNTPSEFLNVASSPNIRFELARQDPEGLPSTGITRQVGTQANYRINQNALLTNLVHWPPEDYINIYVANLQAVLGWAEFPFSNIEGIPEINIEADLDGVFLDPDFVGLNLTATPFASFGRTATHEIGHYLGLRHLDGDGGCEVDDFCSDTPVSSATFSGSCPTTPQSSCGSADMYSNFLNLTDDECMNVFTQCQSERMRLVLQNSPRRMSLLTSQGLVDPVAVANDLGIREVRMPLSGECETVVTPQIILRNYGTNVVSQFQISISETATGFSESIVVDTNLGLLEVQSVNFSSLSLDTERNLVFSIEQVNNGNDQNAINNTKSIQVASSVPTTLPYLQSFENDELLSLRSDQQVLSTVMSAPNETTSNNALTFPFYQESAALGSKQILLLPNLDLTGLTSANLTFDFAYANDSTDAFDGLVVGYSLDCGATFDETQYLFQQFGDQLKTTSRPVGGPFSPIGPSEWRSASINITTLLDETNLRLAIFGVNGSGNNIYVDNINLQATQLQAYDIALTSIDRVPVVTCDGNITAELQVSNEGFQTITNFNANVSVNGSSASTTLQSSIGSGSQDLFFVSFPIPDAGTSEVTISLTEPNGETEQAPQDNSISFFATVNDTTDLLPAKTTFQSLDGWTIATPVSLEGDMALSNGKVQAQGFQNNNIGRETWLVSPSYSTQNLTTATLIFDLAYAASEVGTERLQVLASNDCGRNFGDILYDQSGENLSTTTSSAEFIPSESDWRQVVIDLSSAILFSEIRLAFVFTNGGGNNLFVDNIEIAPVSPDLVQDFNEQLTVYPNPSLGDFQAALNLTKRESTIVTLLDLQGKIQAQFLEPLGLNQTFQFSGLTRGLYFLEVRTESRRFSKRVVVTD